VICFTCRGKRHRYPCNTRLVGLQSLHGHLKENRNILPKLEIEPRFLGHPALSLRSKEIIMVMFPIILCSVVKVLHIYGDTEYRQHTDNEQTVWSSHGADSAGHCHMRVWTVLVTAISVFGQCWSLSHACLHINYLSVYRHHVNQRLF
jgi:hypothetical protein